MTAAYLETGMTRFNRFGLCATTALRTAMVWRASWNVKEAADNREAARASFLGGLTFTDRHGNPIDPRRITLNPRRFDLIHGVYPLDDGRSTDHRPHITYVPPQEYSAESLNLIFGDSDAPV